MEKADWDKLQEEIKMLKLKLAIKTMLKTETLREIQEINRKLDKLEYLCINQTKLEL